MAQPVRSEDELGQKWDRCLTDTAIKTAAGVGLGIVFSAVFFKRRPWPVTLGLGWGLGSGYTNCCNDFKQANLFHGQIKRYVSWGFGVIGIIILSRTIRLTKKFKQVSDIPQHFISRHVKLQGIVQDVQETGLLRVDHIPIYQLPWPRSPRPQQADHLLPVSLAGVHIFEEGIPLLKETVNKKQVWFQMLHVNEYNHLQCVVMCKKNMLQNVCINRELALQGVASVDPLSVPSLVDSAVYTRLLTSVYSAQRTAEQKCRGVWARTPLKGSVLLKASNTVTTIKSKWSTVTDKIKLSTLSDKLKLRKKSSK